MMTYTRKLPDHVQLSDYIKEKADGYLVILKYGKHYYIPLTKEIKKLFKISRREGEIIFGKTEKRFDDVVMTIIDAVYLQVRDTVGGEIQSNIMEEVKSKIEDILAPKIGKEIDKRFDQKLLESK